MRVALAVAEPAPTGDRRFDAAIAAVVEHHLEALPLPSWVNDSSRLVTPEWTPDPDAGANVLDDVPPGFRRHGVLLAASELASV